MPTMNMRVAASVRATSQRLPNLSIQANVTGGYYDEAGNRGDWNDTVRGVVERSPLKSYNDPEWSNGYNTGVRLDFKRHNGYNDQERYRRQSLGFVKRQGTFVKYYWTSFNPYVDPLYHEDTNRTVERVFDLPIIFSFQPENMLFSRFGIQQLDEFEAFIHMSLFFELNYANMRKGCVEPACDPNTHNPEFYQRGYENYSYHGYSAQQMIPKAGDLVKIEAFDSLWTVESVQSGAPEFQFRWHKYWYRISLKTAYDSGMTVDQEVLNDPNQNNYVNDILNTQDPDSPSYNQYPLDVSCVVDQLKKDIIYRPPQVPPTVVDPTCDIRWYPCGDLMGQW